MRSLTGVANDLWSYRPGRTARSGSEPRADLPRLLARARGGPTLHAPARSSVGRRSRSRRRARLGLVVAFLAALGGGLALAVKMSGFGPRLIASIDRAAVRAGLGLTEVAVVGFRRTPPGEIFDAVGLDKPASFATFDTRAAKRRIEALPWVARARMIQILPDTLAIEISERIPYAVWQHRGMLFLIDRQGRELEPISPRAFTDLPLVVGEGAPQSAPALLEALGRYRDIAGRVEAMVRVADRRWTLRLESGTSVALPESGMPAALKKLHELQRDTQLLERAIASIDLRITGRVIIRPSTGRGDTGKPGRGAPMAASAHGGKEA